MCVIYLHWDQLKQPCLKTLLTWSERINPQMFCWQSHPHASPPPVALYTNWSMYDMWCRKWVRLLTSCEPRLPVGRSKDISCRADNSKQHWSWWYTVIMVEASELWKWTWCQAHGQVFRCSQMNTYPCSCAKNRHQWNHRLWKWTLDSQIQPQYCFNVFPLLF